MRYSISAGGSLAGAPLEVTSKMPKILIIEDDDSVASALRDLLKAEGFSVDMATDPVAGLANAQSKPYNVVVSDLQMPGLSGLDVVEQLQRARPHLPVILITASVV